MKMSRKWSMHILKKLKRKRARANKSIRKGQLFKWVKVKWNLKPSHTDTQMILSLLAMMIGLFPPVQTPSYSKKVHRSNHRLKSESLQLQFKAHQEMKWALAVQVPSLSVNSRRSLDPLITKSWSTTCKIAQMRERLIKMIVSYLMLP